MKTHLLRILSTLILFALAGCGGGASSADSPDATPDSSATGNSGSLINLTQKTVTTLSDRGIPTKTTTTFYDTQGYIFKLRTDYWDGINENLDETITYQRDSIGRVIEQNINGETDTFTYDSNGNVLKEVHDLFDNGHYAYAKTYTYDDHNHISLMTYDGDNFSAPEIDIYTNSYDAHGNLLMSMSATYMDAYTYDDNNYILSELHYFSNGATSIEDMDLYKEHDYSYATDGKILTDYYFVPKSYGGVTKYTDYKYDDTNRLISTKIATDLNDDNQFDEADDWTTEQYVYETSGNLQFTFILDKNDKPTGYEQISYMFADGSIIAPTDADQDGDSAYIDCNENDSNISRSGSDVCDGIDTNCDGMDGVIADDYTPTLAYYYRDSDGDGFGNLEESIYACSRPTGYSINSNDCDDNNISIQGNCADTSADVESAPSEDTQNPGSTTTYYLDSDADGFGDPDSTLDATTPPTGYVTDATDCDDTNADIHPGSSEVANGLDDDCDGHADEGLITVTFDSVPDSVTAGKPFNVTYTVKNLSGLTNVTAEVRIHDTAITAITPIGKTEKVNLANSHLQPIPLPLPFPLSPFGNYCTDASPCTTLDSESLGIDPGESLTKTVSVTTDNAAGKYYLIVRILVGDDTLVYSRDVETVEVVGQ
jgi:hypothetical protein